MILLLFLTQIKRKIICEKLIPWAEHTFPEGNFILYQDNARPHKGKKVTEIIKEKICFIPEIPPYSADFNPMELV